MRAIDVYKTRIMELIDEAKLDSIKIEIYERRIVGYDNPIECGISIFDGKDRIEVPTYKNNAVEVID